MQAADAETIAALLLARRDDARPALRAGDRVLSWSEYVAAASRCARWLLDQPRGADAPLHVGLLMSNTVAHAVWLAGAALSGGVAVGLNPTRADDELDRDARHTDCLVVVADDEHAHRVSAFTATPVRVTSDPGFAAEVHARDGAPPSSAASVQADDLFALIFTSGSTSAPKAVRCSHGRIVRSGSMLPLMLDLTADDIAYVAMPLFHSNAIIAGFTPMLAAGGTIALPTGGRFSASGFMDDVRRHGATYANYVGKALAHVLATPARPDDADVPLRVVFGNEASERDIGRFSDRFGCRVVDGYGSTEGGIACLRTPETPHGSLGIGIGDIRIIDPDTGTECEVARFDEGGRLVNPGQSIGELVRVDSDGGFEGYWRNDDAERERRGTGGRFHSGDLGYRDAQGFLYFAGRTSDWLRVDGENLAAAPIERVLAEHDEVVTAAVVGVPDVDAGDQVLAALQVVDPASFDVAALDRWLGARRDVGTKARPRFVRVAASLPQTVTNKVDRRRVAAQGWQVDDPVWWRPGRDDVWRLLDDADRTDLDKRISDRSSRDDTGAPR